ncbi:MAG: helix-turn-helix transcriptional regulator [Granulosicoccus sp.]
MPEYLTTREVAELLRIKERKVYDLAASGALPCSRVIGKLLFPREQITEWVACHNESNSPTTTTTRPAVFLGSHDPLLEWALRESCCGIATLFDGSNSGLNRFSQGEGIATGLHIPNNETKGWNTDAVRLSCPGQPAVLLEWATRSRGLIVSDNQKTNISSISDLAGLRVVPRQTESGAQKLFLELIEQSGLNPSDFDMVDTARTETDVAEAISSAAAHAGFGLASVAAAYKLAFIPIIKERFDLLIDRRSYFEPPLQTLLAFCKTAGFKNKSKTMTGYGISGLGQVRLNAN